MGHGFFSRAVLVEPGIDCGPEPQSHLGAPQVPSEVWDAGEQDFLLLLEPEEFLQGVNQLTQVLWWGR